VIYVCEFVRSRCKEGMMVRRKCRILTRYDTTIFDRESDQSRLQADEQREGTKT